MKNRDMSALQYEDLHQQVYRILKQMILTGELAPGTKLRQEKFAEKLGVSRTPLMKAFSKLEKEMLLDMIPRRGAYVHKCSKQELLDYIDIRMRLEPLGARNAAVNHSPEGLEAFRLSLNKYEEAVSKGDQSLIKEADYQFHMGIVDLSSNKVLGQMISSFNIVIISNQRGLLKDPMISLNEHRSIFRAIESRDADAAEAAMTLHLMGLKARIESMF
ncbi:MAG TPA: GntR family transcriptional regulator [Rectinema sp.]|nr:GntR family transcriptional regulator [Rectinema sp.]HNT60274.1 GntR family transcriptional regulator [Rectinema sp.]HNV37174.1 GntR family transcriptional regulator [Rectinema sp.]